MTFNESGLSEPILRALADLGFEHPTPIQEQTLPHLIEKGGDLVALAQTGTGKTAGFGLPLLERVDEDHKEPQALILCPTRELCLQISRDLESFAKYMPNLNITAVYGGTPIDQQIKSLNAGPQIIVGTPGRTLDLIKRRKLRLEGIDTVILDEADEMLSMGFKDELDAILENTPADKQVWLFSATMPADIERMAQNYMRDPFRLSAGGENKTTSQVKHQYCMVPAKNRYMALKRLVDYYPNVYGIVFCRTRHETKEIAEKLGKDGYNSDALHGDLSQSQRDLVMERFRNRQIQLLIATDVAARGLDVNNLTHVIHYNLPDDMEAYIHRSGRTGRAGKTGESIAIVHSRENGRIRQLEKIIGKKMEPMPIPSGSDICEKQLFTLIDKVEKVEVDEEEIHDYLTAIYKKLEWLDREELIKRFVSIEFNRFLAYYKDAEDLNAALDREKQSGKRDGGRDRGNRNDRSDRGDHGERRSRGGNENFVPIKINLGRKDGISPKDVISLFNSNIQGKKIDLGNINVQSFETEVEVDGSKISQILGGLNGASFRKKTVNVEIGDNSGGGPKRSGKRKPKNFSGKPKRKRK